MRSAPGRASFRFVGGKGGVGKTTCAAALAVSAAEAGRRTLVVSTDPAPSLGDALGARLTGTPSAVRLSRGRAVHAAEIDARRALERWLRDKRSALERIVLRGTWLDHDDVAQLLRLSLPGVDEIAALLEIARFARSRRYDLIVVDTAPTGHTLRMLSTPEMLLALARVFDRMQAKHRIMVAALRGAWSPDAEERLIDAVAREARDLAAILRDPAHTAMSWVTLPEVMAVQETLDAVAALEAQRIAVGDVIVNRLTPPPPATCRWCEARRGFEARSLALLDAGLRRLRMKPALRRLEAIDPEPRGVRTLRAVGRTLTDAAPVAGRQVPARPRSARAALPCPAEARVPPIGGAPAALLLFGGKGGVGKTTCAAAAAIDAARRDPARRVLLISTDPAHSLADALGAPLGDQPARLPDGPPNLQVRELDAGAAYARVRDRYRRAIDEMFDRFSRGSLDAAQDRRVMHDLIDLAPPGIDELAAVIEVTDALGGGTDLVVVDTAPSGHALRLLEMPGIVQEWTKALMAIVLKYQPVVGVGDLGAVLLNLSRGLGRLRTLLADRARTHAVIVTRGGALPRAETLRLVSSLSRLNIAVSAIVVNAAGAGDCGRCRARREAERREISRLRRALRSDRRRADVLIAPAIMPPPHGAAALLRWRGTWRGLPRPAP